MWNFHTTAKLRDALNKPVDKKPDDEISISRKKKQKEKISPVMVTTHNCLYSVKYVCVMRACACVQLIFHIVQMNCTVIK